MNPRFLVLPISLVCLLLVFDPAKAGYRNIPRNVEQARNDEPCESKYLELSPSHTRCLQAEGPGSLRALSPGDQDFILNMHNTLRAKETPTPSDMMSMVWDDTLAQTAAKWAMQCRISHDAMRDRMEPDWPLVKIGQNVGTGHSSFQVMITRMYSEKKRLNYTYGDAYKAGIGHYFQLVSAQTSRVGCAMAMCPRQPFRRIRVCNYAPAFDASRPPYSSGEPCGDCPGHCDASGKLCDCGGHLCYNGGRLDPGTCQCNCQQGWTGDRCEQLDCGQPDPVPSCRTGQLRAEACGQPGTVLHDPNMCPRLCGLCPKVCGGLECKNGGKVNEDTCQCDCPGLLTGDTCEKCPAMDKPYCSRYQGSKDCGSMMAADCPILCGKCITSCQQCDNLGDLNTEDCTCTCKGSFTGPRCETCPSGDELHCSMYSVEHCSVSGLGASLQITCPYRCGVCQETP